jgi:circadian clock protein KaiC
MLADVYTAGGEVLMGTLRWEKEDEERAKSIRSRADFDQKRAALEVAESDTRSRIWVLEQDLERQRVELAAYSSDDQARIVSSSDRERTLRRIRSSDPAEHAATQTRAAPDRRHGSNGNGKSARKNKAEARDDS